MKYLVPLLLALSLIGCSDTKNPAELRGKERFDYLFQHGGKYIFSLKNGMSKGEVKAILGPPDNSDDKYIWSYTALNVQNGLDKTWMSLLKNTDGIYYVFYGDKLILPEGVHWYRTVEEHPQITMHNILPLTLSLSQDDVNKLLNDERAKHLPPDPPGKSP